MKLTRQQLRKLIEASVRKDGDYTIPVEDPVTDPLKDLDYSDEQKEKIKMLALSDDPQTRVQADLLADMGDYESDTDRFGTDTFSQHVRAKEFDIDLLNDLEIDKVIDEACRHWIYYSQRYLAEEDLINDAKSFQEYMESVFSIDDIDEIKQYASDIIDSKFDDVTQNYDLNPFKQKLEKYEKAKELFKRRTAENNIPAVAEHIHDKIMKPLYRLYKDWKTYYSLGSQESKDYEDKEHMQSIIDQIKEGRR